MECPGHTSFLPPPKLKINCKVNPQSMTTTVPNIYAFNDVRHVANAVADHIIHAQNSCLQNSSKRFRIGISGGSLIDVLNQGLLNRNDIKWNKWDIYFVDERLVPFDSPDSNYGLAKKNLLDLIPSDNPNGKPRTFHIDEHLISDPTEAAQNYENLLIKGFAAKDSVKLPMFDLLLLGCAPDGHICSLFPNSEALREEYAWCVAVTDAPTHIHNRITLTVPVICHSLRIAFVVEGATKAPVIKTIMEHPEAGLPSSIVNEGAAGRVAWFVDNEALTDVMVRKKDYKFRAS